MAPENRNLVKYFHNWGKKKMILQIYMNKRFYLKEKKNGTFRST